MRAAAARICLWALAALLAGCGGASPTSVTLKPERADDGWRVSTPATEGMEPAVLARAFDAIARQRNLRTVHSLLVVRHGALVAEGYYGGFDRTRLNDLRSVTKSVTSLLVGIAIARGDLPGVRQRLAAYYPAETGRGADPRLQAITLEDLLTMRSGLRWDEHAHGDLDPVGMYRTRNSIQYVLDHPMEEEPGKVFRYSTGNSQLIAGMLTRSTGKSVSSFAEENLFKPLGITRFQWDTHWDGLNYGGVRLFLTARDMARIGQLCLQNGRWGDRQLVPADWIRISTAPHAQGLDGPYGYHWWVRPQGYTAQGFGGQYVYVFPAEQIVAVLTADPEAGQHIHFGPAEKLFVQHIVGAVRRR
jgi:CubicO group peptidase (beta-lactamase class C family)